MYFKRHLHLKCPVDARNETILQAVWMLRIDVDDARPSHDSCVYIPNQHPQALMVRGDR